MLSCTSRPVAAATTLISCWLQKADSTRLYQNGHLELGHPADYAAPSQITGSHKCCFHVLGVECSKSCSAHECVSQISLTLALGANSYAARTINWYVNSEYSLQEPIRDNSGRVFQPTATVPLRCCTSSSTWCRALRAASRCWRVLAACPSSLCSC